MSNARLIIGDVFDVLASLEPASVDLVMTSPPFLALRSYLPADHEHKSKEIGSEATPGEFIDRMLDVVEACARVLAPHGSLVFELGDSMSGSGGAGGDYDDDGWRKGQPRFGGSASKAREANWSLAQATWLAGVIDTEGSITIRKQDRGPDQAPSYGVAVQVQMMDPEVCERAHAITGVGHRSQQKNGVYHWQAVGQQARYVLLHIWPHLLIKRRQAAAAIDLMRHMEESERRGQYARVTADQLAYRAMVREHVQGWNARGEDRGVFAGTWEPPTPPTVIVSERSDFDRDGWPLPKSKAMIPQLFAVALAYGFNPLTGRKTEPWIVRNTVIWAKPNPPVGRDGDKFRNAHSVLTVATKSATRYWDGDAVRTEHTSPGRTQLVAGARVVPERFGEREQAGTTMEQNPNGAPLLDWWELPTQPYAGSHYATYPANLVVPIVKSMCPAKVCRECGKPSVRITSDAEYVSLRGAESRAMTEGDRRAEGVNQFTAPDGSNGSGWARTVETLGWSDCGHGPENMRAGVVLDPFAGSGTTLQVATGHGRDAIGIDLDERNAELAGERIGGLFLTVEHHEQSAA